VARRFRDRRVFIAGDAAHLWVPYAGYGMNAGGGVEIPFMPHLALLVDAYYNGVSVHGGEGTNRVFGQFSLGAKYTF